MLSQTLIHVVLPLFLASQVKADGTPTHYGYILYPGFIVLDTFGPLEALSEHSFIGKLDLTLISETMDPASSENTSSQLTLSKMLLLSMWKPTLSPYIILQLIIPGAYAPSPLLGATISFVKERYLTLHYLLTICNGAGIAARAGVLDGPKVKWVAQARWVTDGNIWTSSGVLAGIDVMIAFISAVYSNENATGVANGME
ncbi:class I glutamine amidotransferase-like protein [Acephala macrosclerotiorum]|nr:class I glutamine amidotransferase-like protein [Acephala macrosclerotiorum]